MGLPSAQHESKLQFAADLLMSTAASRAGGNLNVSQGVSVLGSELDKICSPACNKPAPTFTAMIPRAMLGCTHDIVFCVLLHVVLG